MIEVGRSPNGCHCGNTDTPDLQPGDGAIREGDDDQNLEADAWTAVVERSGHLHLCLHLLHVQILHLGVLGLHHLEPITREEFEGDKADESLDDGKGDDDGGDGSDNDPPVVSLPEGPHQVGDADIEGGDIDKDHGCDGVVFVKSFNDRTLKLWVDVRGIVLFRWVHISSPLLHRNTRHCVSSPFNTQLLIQCLPSLSLQVESFYGTVCTVGVIDSAKDPSVVVHHHQAREGCTAPVHTVDNSPLKGG